MLFYIIVLFFLVVGFFISTNLDIGRLYLDAYREEFYQEYLTQSFMIVEIILGIFLIFSTSLLFSKSNEGLFVYTVSDIKSKFQFLTSRILTGIFLNLFSIIFSVIACIFVIKMWTPFRYEPIFILKIFALISLKIVFFQSLVFFLQAYTNNFFLVIIPVGLFWYIQTIEITVEGLSKIELLILEIVPLFTNETSSINIYKDLYQYTIIIVIIILFSYLISSIKDHS